MTQQPQNRDHLLEHDYDGIREYDNPMPRWWVYIFWATIVFSAIYPFVFNEARGKDRLSQYEADMAAFRAQHPAQGPGAGSADLAKLAQDPAALALGKTTYAANCAACHAPAGGGLIGPNLTDDYWIHGGTPPAIHKTVAEGVLAKGMPAWNKMLKPDQLDAVVAYIITLHGTNPPGAKAPQGELVPPATP